MEWEISPAILRPSGYVNSVLLKTAIEIVDGSIQNHDFAQLFVNVYQRVPKERQVTTIFVLRPWSYPPILEHVHFTREAIQFDQFWGTLW